jgi:LysR family transcriptional activator of nhaA
MYSLNYQHLRYFWAVARHGNLTRASSELHLTPQTVSAQIRDLENGLEVELFSREGRRLVLTDIVSGQ